jgi:hypothetical protein
MIRLRRRLMTKQKWEIKNYISGDVIYTTEGESFPEVVQKAIRDGSNLSRANLSGADLSGANLSGANLSRAYLSRANLSRAHLSGADLSGANLSGANLSGANLSGADLSGANLSGANLSRAYLSRANSSRANLSGANLSEAIGVNKYLTTPLYILLDQLGKIRAYKLVNSALEGPINGGIKYIKGKIVEVEDAEMDEKVQCARGINVATLDWVVKEWKEGYKILVVEFSKKDIAAIPVGSDGKFRLHRCKVVGEKNLVELGLVKEETKIVSD